MKDKTRKGLEQHAIGGWNNGKVPFGYLPDRVPHSVPAKAAQGMTRTRLKADPECGPWVTSTAGYGTPGCPPASGAAGTRCAQGSTARSAGGG